MKMKLRLRVPHAYGRKWWEIEKTGSDRIRWNVPYSRETRWTREWNLLNKRIHSVDI